MKNKSLYRRTDDTIDSKTIANGRAHHTEFLSRRHDRVYLILLISMTLVSGLAIFLHNRLPQPILPTSDVSKFSEGNAMAHVHVLAGDIGYRIVGTRESIEAEKYVLEVLSNYKQTATGPTFEIFVQTGDGAHRFDFMSKVVMKRYFNITNIIVRLGDPDAPAILFNAHLDSTLPSPGAADDAMPVSVMLETIRILSQLDKFKNSAIFLFNNGEESLQDASHLFATQGEHISNVRQVINLEAAGVRGREILFQANSESLVRAYANVPHPHGSAIANDLFATGLILSDTDFRQFVQYGNITGIDMALYKGSYYYHTVLDNPQNIQPGSTQHMGDNVLALAKYLLTEAELLPEAPTDRLVFFDYHGLYFFVYNWDFAKSLHLSVIAVSVSFIFANMQGSIILHALSLASIIVGLLTGLLFASLTALLMVYVVDNPLSWFPFEGLPVLLFGPITVFGMLLAQYILGAILPKDIIPHSMETITYNACLLFNSLLLGLATWFTIKSSYLILISTLSFLLGHLVNRAFAKPGTPMSIAVYLISQLPVTMELTDISCAIMDLFVPLTGRLGPQTPVDNIIAIIVAILTNFSLPILPVLAHRMGQKQLRKTLLFFVVLPGFLSLTYFSFFAFPYTAMKPKRAFIQHSVNMTSGERALHIGFADAGCNSHIIKKIEEALGVVAVLRVGDVASVDWLSLYPFSQFIVNYRFSLPNFTDDYLNNTAMMRLPWADIDRTNMIRWKSAPINAETSQQEHQRRIELNSNEPHLIWPVILFHGHLANWSLPTMPENTPGVEASVYVIKHAGGYGNTNWSLDLDFHGEEKVKVHYTAIEEEGFWQYKERPGQSRSDVQLLERIESLLPPWVSGMFQSVVTGVYDM